MIRIVTLLGLCVIIFSDFPALAQTSTERDWMWHMGGGWGHWLFGGLMMLLFWGGVIVLIILLVRWLAGGHFSRQDAPFPRRTPLEILQERFAKGEIDKQEYEEKRRLLKEQG